MTGYNTTLINAIIEDHGLQKLNTMTKYPSILTYHEMGEKGCLNEKWTHDMSFTSASDQVVITEKIDGTNARIIVDESGDYIIGSRDELLYSKGDRIVNQSLYIVDTVLEIAEKLSGAIRNSSITGLRVFYGEVYGYQIGKAAKQYTAEGKRGFRIFDISEFMTLPDEIKGDIIHLSTWRENNEQTWVPNTPLSEWCRDLKFLERVPVYTVMQATSIPKGRKEMLEFLQNYYVRSDAGLGGGLEESEGLVLRTPDRSLIRKVRFEDYLRTKKKEGWIE